MAKLNWQKVIHESVVYSEWATPNSIQICGDYKVTQTPSLKVDQYPLPMFEENFCVNFRR